MSQQATTEVVLVSESCFPQRWGVVSFKCSCLLSKAVSAVFINTLCLLKKGHDNKNRNSRPQLEKLDAKIYIEALGELHLL